jgi:hypothetical protein
MRTSSSDGATRPSPSVWKRVKASRMETISFSLSAFPSPPVDEGDRGGRDLRCSGSAWGWQKSVEKNGERHDRGMAGETFG